MRIGIISLISWDFLHQRPFRTRILAPVVRNGPDGDLVLPGKTLANLQPRGSGGAIDEHGGFFWRPYQSIRGYYSRVLDDIRPQQ